MASFQLEEVHQGQDEAAQKRQRLQPIHWSDIHLLADGDPLIKGVLDRDAMSLLFGPSGCGKTFLGLDIAAHVALGEPWCGRRTTQGAVLYIAAEGGCGLRRRLSAYWQHHGLDPGQIPLLIIPDSIDMCQDANQLAALADNLPVPDALKLIVVDTLSRAMAGGNENSPDDMGAFVAACDRLRQTTKAHLLLIHHTGKDNERGARGHSLLRAALDTEISCSNEGGHVTATITKARDSESGAAFNFALEVVDLGTDPDGDSITSCVPIPIEAPERSKRDRTAKLAPAAKITLDALRKALEEAGQPAPASNHVPQGAKVVSMDLWRSYAYAASITKSDTQDAKRKAFNRACENLIARGLVGHWNDDAWTT